eukprot:Protomagalhaensia_wolfi_Nauph_80__840@NODE_1487_length_1506_cov_9_453306_g1153_i0_p1_GENE_NODE_1487_length_1506_cov_9_453306_g1153_i0NODE_1487_length_1506_cov_9_453306_g1153_i0_p1_ORF_typecomplete_len465_score71_18Kdo/PF06293_14/0_0025WaaY/PF06176_11/0_008Pkinase/PF00069_25/0_014Choline_kinase/PF01633_20/0_059RIO1/PF01163_22/0_056Pkinase_fungal/PF17667_1/0_037APH/PF01636_23/0_074_NODE_1487_length_1506_cov_9_453306_g1153_i0951489
MKVALFLLSAAALRNDPLLEIPKQRIQDLCQTYSFLHCTYQNGAAAIVHGTYGAGVKARLELALIQSTGYDVYVNCKLDLSQPGTFKPFCNPGNLVRKETHVPVFMKTSVEKRTDNDHKLHAFSADGWTAWQTEIIAAQNVANTGFGPNIYYIASRATGELHPMHQQVFFQRNLGAWNVNGVYRRLVTEIKELLSMPSSKRSRDIIHFELIHRIKLMLRLLEANLILAYRFHKTGYSHCDLHPANIMIQTHYWKIFETEAARQSYHKSFDNNGWLLFPGREADPPVSYYELRNLRGLVSASGRMFTTIHLASASMTLIDTAFSVKVVPEGAVAPCTLTSACRAEDLVENLKSVERLGRVGDELQATIEKLANDSSQMAWRARLELVNNKVWAVIGDITRDQNWLACVTRQRAIQAEKKGLPIARKKQVCHRPHHFTCSVEQQQEGYKAAVAIIRRVIADLNALV